MTIEKHAGHRLPAESLVARRIAEHYSRLSAARRMFADLVQAQPLKVARLSIHDAVELAGVSVATANRFAMSLGFDGYADFRKELIGSFETLFAPVQRLREKLAEESDGAKIIAKSLREDADNLDATARMLSPREIEQALDLVVAARKIYIAGFDASAHLGGLFRIGLMMTGCDVSASCDGGGRVGAMRQLFRMDERDLVIAIAFPHYFRDTVSVAARAAEMGIPVLSLTDGLGSPLVPISRASLFVNADHAYSPPSSTAILGLIEAFVAAVAARRPQTAELREAFSEAAYPWVSVGGAA